MEKVIEDAVREANESLIKNNYLYTSNVLAPLYEKLGLPFYPLTYERYVGWMNPDGSYVTLEEVRLAVEAE